MEVRVTVNVIPTIEVAEEHRRFIRDVTYTASLNEMDRHAHDKNQYAGRMWFSNLA